MKQRNTHLLRKARVSKSGAAYFITAVTKHRHKVLNEGGAMVGVEIWLRLCQTKEIADVYGVMLMPDHFHVLIKLKRSIQLSEVVRMLKFHIRNSCAHSKFEWQSSFFEHRIRSTEDLESFALYMYLNPYRSKLISTDQRWGYWVSNQSFSFKFESYLDRCSKVPSEWIANVTDPLEVKS